MKPSVEAYFRTSNVFISWAAKRDHEKIHCSPNTDAVDQMHNTIPPLCGCRLFHVKLMRQVCISYKEYYAVNNCNWIGNNYTSRMLPNSRKCREGNLILFLFVKHDEFDHALMINYMFIQMYIFILIISMTISIPWFDLWWIYR